MTLNQVYNKVKEVATNHRQVRTVKEGLPDEWLHDDVKDVTYPAVFFTGLNSATQPGARSYTFNVVIVDRTQEEDQNEMEQLSDCQSIADDLISQLNFGNQPWELDKNVLTEYIRYALEDICSGVSFSITLLIPFAFDACDLPSDYVLPDGSFVYINTNRFMTVYDFIVGTGQPLEDGGSELTNNLFTVPPFVFIGGSLVGYTVTTDRRYITHNATTKKITINNGGVLNLEHVFIVI